MTRFLTKAATVAAAAGALLFISGTAEAHVRVQSPMDVAGQPAALQFRVPSEKEVATTVRVDVALPADLTVTSVDPLDGWTAVTTHPARAATHVTWTAQAGSVIQPNQTVVFGLQVGPLPAKPSISFDALQTYSDGSLVDWNQPTIGATPPQFPAPVVKVAGAPAAAAPDEVKPGVATVQGSSTQATTAAESGAAMLPIVLGTAGVLVLAVLVFVVRRRKAA
jgi:uncharacterized protein YcnI